jgi:hypothetical protein
LFMADGAAAIRALVAQGYTPLQAASLVNGGAGATASAPVRTNDVDSAINATAARAGMSPAHWKAIADIESGLKPGSNSYNPATQYKGLFQIGSRGQGSEWSTHGKGNIYDPMDNANAAADIAARNNAWFTNRYGHAPTPIQTYMMHQQGPGFYSRGAMTNIAGNLPAGDRTPENMTHQGFENYWARKLAARAARFGGDGTETPDNVQPNETSVADAGAVPGVSPPAAVPRTAVSANTGPSSGAGGAAGNQPNAGADSSGSVAAAPDPSTGSLAGTTGGIASALGAIPKFANNAAQNTPPPLQLAPVPAGYAANMMRAQQLAQAMLAQLNPQQQPQQPPPSGGTS